MNILHRLAAWWTSRSMPLPRTAELSTEELDHVGNGVAVRLPGETEEARDARMEAITRSRVQS